MDSIDRPSANLPARLPSSVPMVTRELEVVPVASSVGSRQLVRGLVRHWWRILLVCGAIALPIDYMVYKLAEPTYQAQSMLLIESNQPELFGSSATGESLGSQPAYLQTQVTTMLTPLVINKALAAPGIANLPMIKASTDAKADLQKKLEIQIVPNTQWVRVALESADASEAADIVNAVVEAYREQNEGYGVGVRQLLLADMEKYQQDLKRDIEATKKSLRKAAASGNVVFSKPSLDRKTEDSDQSPQPGFDSLTLDEYRTTKAQLMQTKLQLMEYEARLHVKQEEAQQAQAHGEILSEDTSNRQLRAQVEQEFKRDPEVAGIIEEIRSASESLEHTAGLARKGDDPARVAAQKRLATLNQQYRELWTIKSVQIRQRLLVTTGAPDFESIADLKRKIEEQKLKEARYEGLIKQNEEKMQLSNEDTVNATFLRDELARLNSMFDQVNRKIETLKFTRDKPKINIQRIDRADVPKVKYNDKRVKYMAVLPVVVLFGVLGLFLMLEIRAERVADPDLLSNRVQSEVYSLPPLPTTKSPRKLSRSGVDDQIDRFIQRLDHLRFAVCGDATHTELGRCVLVTSAIGGEGKTTLAAQLAARCGNAGVSTLLIDADMRRAALCPLLDVPEGPGLSDLLKGEAAVEDVLIPVQGGAFHLLAAGTPVQDTSRLFQGRNFAMLIAELRQRYEIIIIDSPPVLPVPDALMLGRWTDGALLAARFEISRSPQVERARRQLDNAGIQVLGTVINGMRSSDAYYGRYSYSRTREPQTDSPSRS
jgi:capsular exopolysaccharide synthesis family protein